METRRDHQGRRAAGTRVITKADTPEGIKKMGLEIITDKDLEIQDKFEALPQSKEKDIVAKYLRGSKLTKKEEAIMDQYAKDNPPK